MTSAKLLKVSIIFQGLVYLSLWNFNMTRQAVIRAIMDIGFGGKARIWIAVYFARRR